MYTATLLNCVVVIEVIKAPQCIQPFMNCLVVIEVIKAPQCIQPHY